MTETFNDVEFIELVVKRLVKNPDEVKVERKVDDMGVLLTLFVNPEDAGIVVGKQGQTAKALRCLLRIVGSQNNARCNLRIHDPRREEQGSDKTSTDPLLGAEN